MRCHGQGADLELRGSSSCWGMRGAGSWPRRSLLLLWMRRPGPRGGPHRPGHLSLPRLPLLRATVCITLWPACTCPGLWSLPSPDSEGAGPTPVGMLLWPAHPWRRECGLRAHSCPSAESCPLPGRVTSGCSLGQPPANQWPADPGNEGLAPCQERG